MLDVEVEVGVRCVVCLLFVACRWLCADKALGGSAARIAMFVIPFWRTFTRTANYPLARKLSPT